MFDLPGTTNVAIGLATKPYPPFRLPGFSRYSIAYHSNGDKSYNHPFTATSFGAALKEGDVLGVGYRPRSGTAFFTRNGRKMEDAFVGLNRWNLFPTIGADGPCSVHVNLGQAGFVFIEANVKKWGLAPSVGTLAPPPAYGSERGSILLDVGGRSRPNDLLNPTAPSSNSPSHRRTHRSRRPRNSTPALESPLTPPPPITPIVEESEHNTAVAASSNLVQPNYVSPGESIAGPRERASSQSLPVLSSRSPSPAGARNPFIQHRQRHSLTHFAGSLSNLGSELQVHPSPDSPMSPNPPTPNNRDIVLHAITRSSHRPRQSEISPDPRLPEGLSRRDPPAYSPLDAFTYAEGVQLDLPAEVIAAALEGQSYPTNAVGQGSRSERRRSRRT